MFVPSIEWIGEQRYFSDEFKYVRVGEPVSWLARKAVVEPETFSSFSFTFTTDYSAPPRDTFRAEQPVGLGWYLLLIVWSVIAIAGLVA